MKKYMSILFVASFLFAFNVSIANADVAGCLTGDNFSRTTGQSCTTVVTSTDCNTGDMFSASTGQPCNGSQSQDNSLTIAQFNNLYKANLKIVANAKALQLFLKNEGYYFGKIDGKFGKISVRAVKDFQDDNNISVTTLTPSVTSDILASLEIARSKGADATIKANLSNVRAQAEIFYDSYNNSYAQVCFNVDVLKAISNAENASGLKSSCLNNNSSYALSVPLKTDSSVSFCVDNTGHAGNGKATTANGINSCGEPSVVNQPSITVLSPNGGEVWQKGTAQTISWNDTNNISTHEINLISYSDNKKYTIGNTQGSSFSWPIGMLMGGNFAPDGAYTIQVCQTGTSVCDSSNSYFKISSITSTFSAGCSSTSGFSMTTGVSCSSSTTTTVQPSPNSLVAYYKLNGDVTDSSGYGNNGTIIGGVSCNTTGQIGQACNFDGTNSIRVPSSVMPTQQYTISAWVKTDEVAKTEVWRNWIMKPNFETTPVEIGLGDGRSASGANGPMFLVWSNSSTAVNLQKAFNQGNGSAFNLRDGNWHQMVATYKPGEQNVYVDGQLAGTSYYAGSLPLTNSDIYIGGGRLGSYHKPWVGGIDEVRIYNYVLSTSEIQQMYTTAGGTTSQPQSSLPDLIISDAVCSPLTPKGNELIYCNITVYNNSAVNINTRFSVNINGTLEYIESLAAYSKKIIVSKNPFGLSLPGPNVFSIVVDWDNKVPESNDFGNNDYKITINIQPTFSGEGTFQLKHWDTLQLNNGLILYADGGNVLGTTPYKVSFKVYDTKDNYKLVATTESITIGESRTVVIEQRAVGFTVKVNAIDVQASGNANWTVSINTNSSSTTQPSITVLSPNGGESWQQGTTHSITWQINNFPINSSVKIEVRGWSYPLPTQTIATVTAANQSYQWTIPSSLPTGDYRVEIYQLDEKGQITEASSKMISQNSFNIIAPTTQTQPSISFLSPSGGEVYSIGNTIPIRWTSFSDNNDYYLYYVRRTGSNPVYGSIGKILSTTSGSYQWTIPESVTPYIGSNIQIVISKQPDYVLTPLPVSDIASNPFTINTPTDIGLSASAYSPFLTFPAGCTSTKGYSITTGKLCSSY